MHFLGDNKFIINTSNKSKFEKLPMNLITYLNEFLKPRERFKLLFFNKLFRKRLEIVSSPILNDFLKYKELFSNYCGSKVHCNSKCNIQPMNIQQKYDIEHNMLCNQDANLTLVYNQNFVNANGEIVFEHNKCLNCKEEICKNCDEMYVKRLLINKSKKIKLIHKKNYCDKCNNCPSIPKLSHSIHSIHSTKCKKKIFNCCDIICKRCSIQRRKKCKKCFKNMCSQCLKPSLIRECYACKTKLCKICEKVNPIMISIKGAYKCKKCIETRYKYNWCDTLPYDYFKIETEMFILGKMN